MSTVKVNVVMKILAQPRNNQTFRLDGQETEHLNNRKTFGELDVKLKVMIPKGLT